MTQVQKVIKYLAIAFAIFLVVNIISACFFGLFGISKIFNLSEEKETIKNMTITELGDIDIKGLDIELSYSNLIIKNSETLKIETDDNNIKYEQNGDKLLITEESRRWFNKNDESNIIIYLPENTILNEFNIQAGAGEININKIDTYKLDFEFGAGKVEIQNLNVRNKAKLEGGAGKISILDGTINDLDLDMGVGEFEIKTILTGENNLNAGIGKLAIQLNDGIENYKIKANKGIGNITVDGKNISNDEIIGNGSTYIKIDGGIGNIDIK